MPHYVVLGRWTEQGIRMVKETAKRADVARRMAQKFGGKLEIYYTMGEYDTVSVVEMPSDEAFNKFALWVGSQGNVRTRSMKAWTPEEISKLTTELP